jgi:hypothetical protein
MKQANKVDFTGQTIYIGLDVHRKSWSVSIYLEHFEHKTFTQPPKVEVLVSYLKRHFPGAAYKAVYEAGYCGFWIHDNLRQDRGAQRSCAFSGLQPNVHANFENQGNC